MHCRRAFLGCCGRENPDSCYIFLFSHFSSKHPGQTAFHRSSGEKKRGFWRAFPLLLWACLVLIFIRFLAKTQKRVQTGCVFSGISSPRVCGPRRIHGREDSPKVSSRSAFSKNQPRSPPCTPSRLPTPSPAAPTPPRSVTLVRSPVYRRWPKLRSRLQSDGRSPSPATPMSIPCPLREQDIRSAPGPSRARCSSTTRPTPPRCRPKRRARASPHKNHAAAAELGLVIFSPRAAMSSLLLLCRSLMSSISYCSCWIGSPDS
jgi:hypothetical protein